MRGRWSDLITDDEYRLKLKSQIKVTDQGCWEWQGYRHPKGYGDMSYRCRNWRVHRLAYHLFRGPIPKGLVICHTCDNRPCCNPDHLFPGTIDINNKDMAAKGRCKHSAAAQKACKHGHLFTPENTYVDPRGFRNCRECNRIRLRSPEYRANQYIWSKRRRELKKAQSSGVSESEL